MRRTASEILRNLETRVAKLERQASRIRQTRWKLDHDWSMHETWKKEFKDSEGRVTSYMHVNLYKETRTPRGYGWAVEFTDFGQSVEQGKFLYYGKKEIYQDTSLYWERSDDMFYETKEEAMKASKKFISWLKKNRPKSFIYYRQDFSGVDWVHDGYV